MTAPANRSRAALVLLAAGCLAGCSRDKTESPQAAQPQRRSAVSVTAATVEQKTIPLQIQAIGTVEASSVVSVKAQVGGELLQVHVKEGQDVKKGDLLFAIDPRIVEAAVAQAQANLARDQGQLQQARAVLERDQARVVQARAALARDEAQAKNAQVQAQRYQDLFKRELISREQVDQIQTNADALAATVRADQADVQSAEETVRADQAAIRAAEQLVRAGEAALESVRVQLGYTVIRAPIDGRAGSIMLNQGNVVRAGGTTDSTLLVINQVKPIYVSFTVPQQQLPTIKRYMAAGPLEVAAVPAGDARPVKGVVTFIDNAVDAATGTIKLKATFANPEGRLWPGQFASVTLTLATEPDAIVIPSQAVQAGQQGAFVYVVKPDSTVDLRRIVAARTQGSETVVAKGLQAGEQVVTDGQARLTPGAKVEVRSGERGPGSGRGEKAAGDGTKAAEGGRPGAKSGGQRPGKAGGDGAERPAKAPGDGGERPAKAAGDGAPK
jgi:multidrug efflux system membrane fusion protein